MIKKTKLFIIILLSLFLVGCSVQNETTITISEDKKVNFSTLIAFDKDLLSSLSGLNAINSEVTVDEYIKNNMKDNYLDGFKKEEYAKDDLVGNVYSYDVNNIDSITDTQKVTIDINDSIINKKLFYKDEDAYVADFNYDLSNIDNFEDVKFNNVFIVNLPSSVISSNADEVYNNGKTLKWNISNGEVKNIKFTFTFRGNKAYYALGSIGASSLSIIIFLVAFIKRKLSA